MDKEFINNYRRKVKYRYIELDEKHRQEKLQLEKELEEMTKRCDHTYPDGKTAIDGVVLVAMCSICGWSDF